MLSNLFFLLLFTESIENLNPKINETVFCTDSKKNSKKLDQVFIEYNDLTSAIFYKITYYPKKLYITSDGFKITNKKIINNDTIKIVKSYLTQFFVDKTEKIELKRTEIEGPITGEYSTIKITLYFKNGETEIFSNTIGSEDYIIEYDPKFLSFIRFIEEIAK